jgi:hypothetical protein
MQARRVALEACGAGWIGAIAGFQDGRRAGPRADVHRALFGRHGRSDRCQSRCHGLCRQGTIVTHGRAATTIIQTGPFPSSTHGASSDIRTRSGTGPAPASHRGGHRPGHHPFAGRRRAPWCGRMPARQPGQGDPAVVVRYLEGGGRQIGTRRGRAGATDPENTIASVKRFMGRGLADVAGRDKLPYRFVDKPPACWRCIRRRGRNRRSKSAPRSWPRCATAPKTPSTTTSTARSSRCPPTLTMPSARPRRMPPRWPASTCCA